MKRPLSYYYRQKFTKRYFFFNGSWSQLRESLERNDLILVSKAAHENELKVSGYVFFAVRLTRVSLFRQKQVRLVLLGADHYQSQVRITSKFDFFDWFPIGLGILINIGSFGTSDWRMILGTFLASVIMVVWFHLVGRTEENVLIEEIEDTLDLTEYEPNVKVND
jgi:hypothetical protein